MTKALTFSRREGLLLVEQATGEFGKQIAFLAVPVITVSVMNLSVGQIALLSTCTAIAAIAGSATLAWASGRARVRRIVIAGCLVYTGGLIGMSLGTMGGPQFLWVFVAGALVTAFVTSVYRVGTVVSIQSAVEPLRRAQLNSWTNTIQAMASVGLPPLIGAVLVFGYQGAWLLADALTWLFSCWVFSLLLPRSRNADEKEQTAAESEQKSRSWWQDSHVRAGVWAVALLGFARTLATTVLAFIVLKELGLNSGSLGTIFAVGGIGFLGGAILSRWVSLQRYRLLVTMILAIVCLLVLSLGAGAFAPPIGAGVGLAAFMGLSAVIGLLIEIAIDVWRQQTLSTKDLAGVTAFSDTAETLARLAASGAAGLIGISLGARAVLLFAAGAYLLAVGMALVALRAVTRTAPEGSASPTSGA
ncbi:MAG: MFS transporter [Bowdeniella nasicola]|nr:MFS transporter [Bowdeniella nasicola]